MNADSAALIRAVRGPIMMITVGILFAMDIFTRFSFQETWPAILIVLGVLGLAFRAGSRPRVAVGGVPPAPSSQGGMR